MKALICENNSSGTSSPFMVTDSLGKLFTGLTSQTGCLMKSLKRNKVPWQGDKLSGEITLNKWLKNKIVLELAPSLQKPKKETPSIYENNCSFDQKRKSCPYKAGVNRLKSYKSSNLLLCKIILWISFPTTATRFFQLRTYPTTAEVSHHYLLTIKIQCSNLSKFNNFFLNKKRCAATIKLKALLMILQSLQFILFCVQKVILYQIVARISKRLFLLMTLCTSLMRRTS